MPKLQEHRAPEGGEPRAAQVSRNRSFGLATQGPGQKPKHTPSTTAPFLELSRHHPKVPEVSLKGMGGSTPGSSQAPSRDLASISKWPFQGRCRACTQQRGKNATPTTHLTSAVLLPFPLLFPALDSDSRAKQKRTCGGGSVFEAVTPSPPHIPSHPVPISRTTEAPTFFLHVIVALDDMKRWSSPAFFHCHIHRTDDKTEVGRQRLCLTPNQSCGGCSTLAYLEGQGFPQAAWGKGGVTPPFTAL